MSTLMHLNSQIAGTDVVDSLTSEATTSALSAKQGKILDTKIDEKLDEPEEEGLEGQALITDGDGGRAWGDVTAITDITNAAYQALPTSEKMNPKKYYNITDLPAGTDVNVIDSLTSTSATDALSAKQGKVLKDEIDTLANLIKVGTESGMTSVNGNMTVNLDATKYHILAAYAQGSGQICLPYKAADKSKYFIHVVFEDAQTSAIVNTQVNVTYYYVEI